jgi:hypothetical protein
VKGINYLKAQEIFEREMFQEMARELLVYFWPAKI